MSVSLVADSPLNLFFFFDFSAVDSVLPPDAKQLHHGLRLPSRHLGHHGGQPAHLPAAHVHPVVCFDVAVQGE